MVQKAIVNNRVVMFIRQVIRVSFFEEINWGLGMVKGPWVEGGWVKVPYD